MRLAIYSLCPIPHPSTPHPSTHPHPYTPHPPPLPPLPFYQQLTAALTHGPVAVATVIHTQGSVPREVGAKLLVCSDGRMVGTIGGGAGEAKVLRVAQAVLETGEKQLVAIDLSGAPQRETQGVCGGQMQVWVERWQGEGAIALSQRIQHHLEQGQSFFLVTPLTQYQNPHEGSSTYTTEDFQFFQEILEPPPTLLIVGAGHCGIQLAKVAHLIGFQIMVQDERDTWANPENFPQATRLFHDSIASAIDALQHHSHLYVALVTRGFDYDLAALKALLPRKIPCRYIGMIGSQKRVRKVMQVLQEDGIPLDSMPAIHAPIGLDIGALTPEEIAVSISAELILVRRGRKDHQNFSRTLAY